MWRLRIQEGIGYEKYLICNSVQNCNDAWQATANSNSNNTGQRNTEDNKKHIETKKDNRQPEISKTFSSGIG